MTDTSTATEPSYEANTIPELQAEIDRRPHLSRTGVTLKPDLIKILVDDDNANKSASFPDDKTNEELTDTPESPPDNGAGDDVEVEATKEPMKDEDGNDLPPNFTGGHIYEPGELQPPPQPEPTYDEKDGLIGPKAGAVAPSPKVGDGEDVDVPAQTVAVSDQVDDTTAAQVRTFSEADTANAHAAAAAQAVDNAAAALGPALHTVPSHVLEDELERRRDV